MLSESLILSYLFAAECINFDTILTFLEENDTYYSDKYKVEVEMMKFKYTDEKRQKSVQYS